MKLKHLQSALSSVPTPQFPDPDITLEQYATSPILCSYIINAALQNGDIGYGRSVLDLGCGTGMLSIGSAIVGTSSVTLVDCDEAAIEVSKITIMQRLYLNLIFRTLWLNAIVMSTHYTQ